MEVSIEVCKLSEMNSLLSEIKELFHDNIQKTAVSPQKNTAITQQLQEHPSIPGLYYCDNCITEDEEKELINNINKEKWSNELSRRVQHYGYKYDYKKRKINKDDYLGDLPKWTNNAENKIFDLINGNKNINLPYKKFDQLIINEYQSGQGISAHVDCVPCFTDGIITMTVGNSGIMTFSKDGVSHDVKLKRRSVAILSGSSRYKWTHEINKTKNKNFSDVDPRISLTFRKCIL
jgi:alkylated DNA repair dioxygenase AlkB